MHDWEEHSETESFLIEIQGRPELMYTDIEIDLYKGLLEKIKTSATVDKDKQALRMTLEQEITQMIGMIDNYMEGLDKAAMRLGNLPQQEKDRLSDLFEEISNLELKIAELYEKAF